MAFLHRHRYASFTTPKRVPLEPVEVDWSHPLSRGLVALYLPGVSFNGICKSDPALSPSSAVRIGASSSGPALIATAANQSLSTLQVSAIETAITAGGGVSLYWKGDILGSGSFGTNGFVGGLFSSTANSPQAGIGVVAGAYLTIAWRNGTTGTSTSYHTGSFVGPASICGTFAFGSAATGYLNGESLITSAMTTPTFTGGDTLRVGASDYPNYYPDAATAAFLVYARPLSAFEATWLHNEPFAMLRPAQRKIRAFVSTSAPAPFRRQMKTYLRR